MKNAVSQQHLQESAQRADIERKLVKLADSIIAGNPGEAADLIWRERADSSKICTIPPGVDTDLFRPLDRADCRRELGLSERDKVVAFIGRIDPIKGIDTLLAATRHLQREVGDSLVVLIIGGDLDENGEPIGALRDVASEAQSLGITASIRLIGAQPQNRLPLIYSAADVVCVPSRYESFGHVAVESMACGVPVVASRAGGMI
jgi:D-inositol-3-phosphate glycosyltransferase